MQTVIGNKTAQIDMYRMYIIQENFTEYHYMGPYMNFREHQQLGHREIHNFFNNHNRNDFEKNTNDVKTLNLQQSLYVLYSDSSCLASKTFEK